MTDTKTDAAMLRPIDALSEMVGLTGLVRAQRLDDEADEMEYRLKAQGVKQCHYENTVRDRRHHASLIREIHRLSNPDYKE